jgi:hypothetical protein
MTWSTTTSGGDTVLIQAVSTSDTEATLFSDSVNGSPAGDDGTYLDRLGNATYRSYFLNNDSVVQVEGTLDIEAFLITDTTCGSFSNPNGVINGLPIWTINSGGTLTFGSEETISSIDVWNQPEIGYRGTRSNTNGRTYESDNAEFLVNSGSQLNIYGCNFYMSGYVWVEGTTVVKGSKLRLRPLSFDTYLFQVDGSGSLTLSDVEIYLDDTDSGANGIQFRSSGLTFSANNVTLIGGTQALAAAYTATSASIFETDNLKIIGTTYAQNIRNYSDGPNNAGLSFATPYNEWYHRNPLVYPVTINQETSVTQPGVSAGLASKGVQFQLFQYQPTVVDDSGSALVGAELYLAGTDDGNSVDDSAVTAGTITGTGYDFTTNSGVLVYTAISDSNGLLIPAYDDAVYTQFGEETQDGYLITSIVARLGQTPGSEIPRNVRGPYNGGITAYGKFDIQISDLFDDTDLQSKPEGAPFTGKFTQFTNPFVDTATYPLVTAAAITGIAFTAGAVVVSASKTWAEFAHYLEWRVTQTDISYRWDTARYWEFQTDSSGVLDADLVLFGATADISNAGTIVMASGTKVTLADKASYTVNLEIPADVVLEVSADSGVPNTEFASGATVDNTSASDVDLIIAHGQFDNITLESPTTGGGDITLQYQTTINVSVVGPDDYYVTLIVGGARINTSDTGLQSGSYSFEYIFDAVTSGSEPTVTVVIRRQGWRPFQTEIEADQATVSVNARLTQKLDPTGQALYTGSSSTACSIVIDGSDAAHKIDIADATVLGQAIFDELEDASVLPDGMLVSALVEYGANRVTGYPFVLGLPDEIQIRREDSGDSNAAVRAAIFHASDAPVDNANGDVRIVEQLGSLTAQDLLQLRYRLGLDGDTEEPSINTPDLATQASVDVIDDNVDEILLDTAEIGTAGAGLTTIPWSADWDAAVESEVTDALTAQGLTSARAGYLDKLNVSGTLAHSDAAATYQADVSSLLTSTTFSSALPANFADLAITTTTGLVSVGSLATDVIAEINATVDTALSDYGAYTGTPPSASDIRAEIDSNSTQLAAILLDTGTTIPSTLSGLLTSTAFTNALPSNFSALGINASGHISRVTLVDANTDMRGTDSALTTLGSTAPFNWIDANAIAASAITEIQSGLATPSDIPSSNITAIKAKTDQLTFTVANQVDANALTGGGGDDAETIFTYFDGQDLTNFKADIGNLSTFNPTTDGVTVATNNDKTGYSLSTSGITTIVSAVWSAATRTLTSVADSSGITTLLSRLTSQRAANIDNLNGSISDLQNHGDSNWSTATGFSTHSTADVADAVWDEPLSGHTLVGSSGTKLSAASTHSASDVWFSMDLEDKEVTVADYSAGQSPSDLVDLSGLSTFDPNSDIVNSNITQVAGSNVAGVAAFHADVNGELVAYGAAKTADLDTIDTQVTELYRRQGLEAGYTSEVSDAQVGQDGYLTVTRDSDSVVIIEQTLNKPNENTTRISRD